MNCRLSSSPQKMERKRSLREADLPWDLSNLCLEERIDQESTESSPHGPGRPLAREYEYESSLYPNPHELDRSTLPDLSVEEVFEQAERYNRMRMLNMKESLLSCSQSSGRPRAFQYRSPKQNRQQEFPSWVEAPTVQRQRIPNGIPNAPILHSSNQSSAVSFTSSAVSFTPLFDLDSSEEDHSWSTPISCSPPAPIATYPTRPPPRFVKEAVQVEVAPGHYMPLRGSDETMYAIEMGYSRTVTCFACQAHLSCVPDCELVICPDCRVLSPVDAFTVEDDRKMEHGHRSDESACSSAIIGGVGLGLKCR
jgi:hypothetical protein